MKKNFKREKANTSKKDKSGLVQKCLRFTKEGAGVVKFKGKDMEIRGLIPGESAEIKYFRKGEHYWGTLLKIDKESGYRRKPECQHFEECGGCHIQHLSYEGQLMFKHDVVSRLFDKYGKVNEVIGMESPYNYRNKIHAAYGRGDRREVVSGFYSQFSHRLIPVEKCMIQDSKADKINATIRRLMKSFKLDTYEERSRRGFLRHVLIKCAQKTDEVMVVLVGGSRVFPRKKDFVKALTKEHPEITTVVFNINDKETSMVLGEKETVLFGKGYITDILCGLKFKISPKSFYQVNSIQTEKLYNKAIEMASFSGRETVLDAYSGIGTIGMILSKKVKRVVSVELNRNAHKDAIENSKANGIKNVRFYNDDAGDFMVNMAEKGEKIHTVIMDPPRSGSDEKFLSSLIKIKPKQVIYVSCNPETQARDAEFLTARGYKIEEIQPVDLFPHTYHVENIIKLSLK